MPKKNDDLNKDIPIENNEEAVENIETPVDVDAENVDSATVDAEETPENIKNVEFEEIAPDDSIQDTPSDEEIPEGPVTVQPVEFASFEELENTQGEVNKNLDILMDVKLQLTVELGRAEMPIKKVLELTRGSIVELQKVAGEPVELYANGKLVAHGEVVVIEDNFGLRITNITTPENMLSGI